jgi:hypothetical protein
MRYVTHLTAEATDLWNMNSVSSICVSFFVINKEYCIYHEYTNMRLSMRKFGVSRPLSTIVISESNTGKNTAISRRHIIDGQEVEQFCRVDVCGSVHHGTILTVKNPTRCNSVSKLYHSLF